jgi:hypothetical protein
MKMSLLGAIQTASATKNAKLPQTTASVRASWFESERFLEDLI